MAMNRRRFLSNSFVGAGGMFLGNLFLTACGGGGGYGGGSVPAAQGGNCKVNGVTVDVSLSHSPNHTVTIPLSDVQAGATKTYLLNDNGSGHVHQMTITSQDFAALLSNQGIQVFSTGPGHTHMVTVNCV